MNSGKQIRLYLVDGTPGGLLTAEIMNWTGHVVAAPRSDLGQLLHRDEARRTGVYLLLGDDPDTASGTAVYVGEGDEIASRLRQHARPESANGKDFWNRVILLTSKDSNLTKAHARYLEARLILMAKEAQRARVINSTAPPLIQLPEADVADMEFYLAQAHIVLPVLGVNMFRAARVSKVRVSAAGSESMSSLETIDSPEFTCEVAKHGLVATAREIDGEFTVMAGSLFRARWTGTIHPGYQRMHQLFLEDGTIEVIDEVKGRLTRDVVFSSPSAAAAVMAGRAANGRTAWVIRPTGMTFGEWQNRGVTLTDDSNAESS